MFKFRHQIFIQSLNWAGPFDWKGLEFDRYDTPATVYTVCRNRDGRIVGTVRIKPTTLPYMIQEIWPHMVTDIELPQQADTWEASRIAVCPTLSRSERSEVLDRLIESYMDMGLSVGAKRFLALMPSVFWRSVFGSRNWQPTVVGPSVRIDGIPSVVATLEVSETEAGVVLPYRPPFLRGP